MIKVSEIPLNKEIGRIIVLKGLRNVENFYKEKGFLDFRIMDKRIIKGKKGDILYVYIFEGKRKIVKNVEIKPDTLKYLLKYLRKNPPFYYEEKVFARFEKKLYSIFPEKGYVFFNSKRFIEGKNDSLDIIFKLNPGKRVRVKNICVKGLSPKTRKKIALDAIELKKGEYISMKKIYLSIKNLYATGIFRNVDYEIKPNSDSTEADIIFKLKEEKMRVLRMGFGYSSDGYSQLKFELEHLNIFNNAQKLALITKFQFNLKLFLHEEFSIRYQDPHFLFKRHIFILTPFYYMDRVEDVKRYGIESRYFIKKDIWIFETNLIWQIVKSIERKINLFYLNGIGFSYSRDKRNNILNPSRGYYLYSYLNTYGAIFGGTENMVKIGYDLSLFKKLNTYIFALKFSGGFEIPYLPTTSIPFSERFLLGGEGTVRGVRRYSIGEYDPRGIKSGTNFMLLNLEMRKILKNNLQFVFFFDMGTLSNIFSYKSFKNTGYGFGIGIRYFISIVPFRVDLATNNHVFKTKEYFLYFGIGQYF